MTNIAYEALHGVAGRLAATTKAVTATIAASSSGLVVRLAATASPTAQIHQAPGWSIRGSRRTLIAGSPRRPAGAKEGRDAERDDHEHAEQQPDPAGPVARGVGAAGERHRRRQRR